MGSGSASICNLCGGTRHRRLPFHYLWHDDRYTGLRCRACDLIFLDRMPDDQQLVELYSEEYFDTGLHGLDAAGVDYETLADERRRTANEFIETVIRAHHPQAESIFEIGAAMGHFLQSAIEAGYRASGVEISRTAVERARVKFNLELICGDIGKLDLSKQTGQWDVVYAGDLLEHLRDPSDVLSRAYDLLAPGGLCVMLLPGTFNLLSTRLAFRLLQLTGRSKQLPDKPYHLYEYTDDTARRMFSKFFPHVKVISTATPPARMNLKTRTPDYLLKYLLQYINYPLTRATGRFGDRMVVIARKSAAE